MIHLVAAAALAAPDDAPREGPPVVRPRQWEIALGSGWIPSRGIVTAGTVDGGVAWFPAELLGVRVQGSAGVAPNRIDGRTVQRTSPPDLSVLEDHVAWSTSAALEFVPLHGTLEAGRRTFGLTAHLLAGTGVVSTEDAEILAQYNGNDPAFLATQYEVHPMLLIGGGFRVAFSDAFGLRLQLDQARWIEVYEGTTTHNKHRESVSAALTLRPARR